MDAQSPDSCSGHPDATSHTSSNRQLTFVFETDGSNLANERIRQNLGILRDAGLRSDRIEVVGPAERENSGTSGPRTSFDRYWEDLKSCIVQRPNNSGPYAIIGAGTVLDETTVAILSQKIRGNEIFSWHIASAGPARLLTRLVSCVAGMVQRVILGTGKNESNGGGALVGADSLDRLEREGIDFSTIDQLIAGCRIGGSRLTETRIGSTALEGKQLTIRSTRDQFSRAVRFWWQQIAFPEPSQPPRPSGSGGKAHSGLPVSRKSGLITVAFLAAAIAVLFANLGYPLFEPDETRNAQLALNILESGEWLSLKLDDEHYWNKPPLQAWMTAIAYSVFGTGEAATRMPCAACGFLTLVTVLVLGSRLFGYRTALIGAALLLICTGFVTVSHYVTMDASLTFFTTLMVLATLLGIREARLNRAWLLLAGFACGLGMLTKGPVILILALPPVLLHGWFQGNTFWKKRAFWFWPGVPAFLLAGPWFIATGIVHPDFLVHFFWKHNLVRFSEAFDHREPFWYYGPMLVILMYPACFLLPALCKRLLFSSRPERLQFGGMYSAILLAGLWPLVFFSIADAKLPTYILPAIPMICLLLGRVVDLASIQSARTGPGSELQKTPGALATSAAIMTGIILVVGAAVFQSVQAWMIVPLVVLVLTAISLLILARSRTAGAMLSWTGAIGVAIIFVGTGAACLLPGLAEYKSVHMDVARKTHEQGFENTPVLYFGVAADGSSFWLDEDEDTTSIENEDYELAKHFLEKNPKTILVTSRDNARSLSKHLLGVVELTPDPEQKKLYSARVVAPIRNTAKTRDSMLFK